MSKKKRISDHPFKEAFLQMASKEFGRELSQFEHDRILCILKTDGVDALNAFVKTQKSKI